MCFFPFAFLSSIAKISISIETFGHRIRRNTKEKTEIAQKAVFLIKDGDIILLDQSSTAFYLVNELILRRKLTIVIKQFPTAELLWTVPGKRSQ